MPQGTNGFAAVSFSKNPTTSFAPLRVSQYSGPLDNSSGSSTTTTVTRDFLDNKNNLDFLTTAVASDVEFEEMILLRNREMLQQAEDEHRQLYQTHLRQKKGRKQIPHYSEEEFGDSLFHTTRPSFKNVESMSERLFAQQPMLALVIFASAGLLVAYLLGIFFLEGYMSSMNPALNGGVPYFEDDLPTDEDQILLLNSLYDVKTQNQLPSLWFW